MVHGQIVGYIYIQQYLAQRILDNSQTVRPRGRQSCCTAGCSVWGCPSRAPGLSRTWPCPAWHTGEAPRQWRWRPGVGLAWGRSRRSSRKVRGLRPPGCPPPRSWTGSPRRSPTRWCRSRLPAGPASPPPGQSRMMWPPEHQPPWVSPTCPGSLSEQTLSFIFLRN